MANERKDPLKDKWIARDGSIYVESLMWHKADLGNKYQVQQPVAFNVGREVAEHMVRLHNQTFTVASTRQEQIAWLAVYLLLDVQHLNDRTDDQLDRMFKFHKANMA